MTLVADVFFVNEIPFLIIPSRKIKIVTVEHIRTQTATQLSNSLAQVFRLYGCASYNVKVIPLDIKFEPVETIMPETVTCNFSEAREHVGEIEHEIRFIKERVRNNIAILPFKKSLNRVIIELVYFTVLWRNAISTWETGSLVIYSPYEIITGLKMDFKKHCKLDFGEYVEVHDEPNPTNGMKFRTAPCVALGPTGSL